MAVTFTVEDGSGVTDATTYVNVADADQIVEDYGLSWVSGVSEDDKKQGLNAGSQFIDQEMAPWKGTKYLSTQGLAFPRAGVVDINGYAFDVDVIPENLRRSVVEAAVYWTNNSKVFPKVDSGGALKKKKIKIDVIEIDKEYVGSDAGSELYAKIQALLWDLRDIGGGVNVPVSRG